MSDREACLKVLAAAAPAALFFGQIFTGCASTGVPKAPSLMLPQVVRAPQAERQGGHVDLRWTTPNLSTDRQPLAARKHGAGTLTAELCRVEGASCVVFTRQTVTAGEAASARDVLHPDLSSGPARLVHYRIRILNGAGRSAGWSRDASAAAGEAPSGITMLAAATTGQGLQLTWQSAPAVQGDRIVLQAVSSRPGGQERNLSAPAGAGGVIDSGAVVGDTVRYTVLRTRTVQIDGTEFTLNGESATVTATVGKDIFPPSPPRGLVAVSVQMESSAPEIDLSWEPNTEPDLTGYVVYRADAGAPGAAPLRLTAEPTVMVSYRDASVKAGHLYRYTVVAVDRSGNTSGPSPAAEEQLR